MEKVWIVGRISRFKIYRITLHSSLMNQDMFEEETLVQYLIDANLGKKDTKHNASSILDYAFMQCVKPQNTH